MNPQSRSRHSIPSPSGLASPGLHRSPVPAAGAFLTGVLLIGSCGGGGGGGDLLNRGIFSPDAFNHTSPHGPQDPPLRRRATSVFSNEELALLHTNGLHSGVIYDYNAEPGGFQTTVAPAPFTRCAAGRIDSDPESDYLIAQFDTTDQPSRFLVQSLRSDAIWVPELELFVASTIPPLMATGDVDWDGRDEIAIVWDDPQGIHLGIFDDGMLIHETPLFCYIGSSNDVDREGIELGLADIDADGRDEVVVLGNRGPGGQAYFYEPQKGPLIDVFDDADSGFAMLEEKEIEEFRSEDWGGVGSHGNRARLVLGDFFDDISDDTDRGRAEVALTRLVYSDDYGHDKDALWLQYETLALTAPDGILGLYRWCREGIDYADRHIIFLHAGLGYPGTIPPEEGLVDFDVIAADLDGDCYEELVSTWFTVGSDGSWMNPTGPGHFLVFNIVLNHPRDDIASLWSVPDRKEHLPDHFPEEWDGNELHRVGSFQYSTREHAPIEENGPWPDFQAGLWSLVSGDPNALARDVVYSTASDGGFTSAPHFRSMAFAQEDGGKFSLVWDSEPLPNLDTPPQLIHADWDNDDYCISYTGDMTTTLGDPVPIIVMAAPPWKADTSQNYGDSYTEYSYAHGKGTTHSVTNGITASVWAGYEISGPFDIFSASGRVVFDSEFAWTKEETEMVSYSTFYATPYDEDVIVFQGTLYDSYSYEVVSCPEPKDVGKTMTIDLPVASKRFVWTLAFFNEFMDPSNQIDPSVFGTTIGDPASYMTPEDARTMVTATGTHVSGQGYVGWMTPDVVPLVMHGGYSGMEIRLSEQNSLLEERSWSVTAEQEYKAGPVVAGFSAGIFEDQVYGVECMEENVYHGQVGGIEDPVQYSKWSYDFGLVVYNRGLYRDDTGWHLEPKTTPFQIETYYTIPTGSNY